MNKWLFSLIATGQCGSMSQTMKEGTFVSQNGTPFVIGTQKSGKLHSFDMALVKNWNEVPQAIIAMLSDYTLWHRRMEHTHQHVIKHLGKNMEGGPHQTIKALELNTKCPCQILYNKMDKWKGSSKPSLMELRPCSITLANSTVSRSML